MRNFLLHRVRIVLALLVASSSTPTFAATVVCSGTVSELTVTSNGSPWDGLVLLRLSSMSGPALVCSLNQNWNVQAGFTTTPTHCKTMYSAWLAARLSGLAVNDVYFDGPVPSACNLWSPTTPTQANVRNYRL
jgi:hypothetical protein